MTNLFYKMMILYIDDHKENIKKFLIKNKNNSKPIKVIRKIKSDDENQAKK